MYAGFSEFSLGEFGATEFAFDNPTPVVEAVFVVAASAVLDWQTQDVFQTAFTGIGATTPGFTASLIQNTSLGITDSLAQVVFPTQVMLPTTMNGVGATTVNMLPVLEAAADFIGSSGTTVLWVVSEGTDLTANGAGTVVFLTQMDHNIRFTMAGAAPAGFSGQVISNVNFAIASMSSINLETVLISNTGFHDYGQAVSNIRTTTLQNAGFAIQGYVTADFRMQSVRNAAFAASAASQFSIQNHVYQNALMKSNGNAVSLLRGNLVTDAQLVSSGYAETLFKPGSTVVLSFSPSKDVVIRPYEIRGAIWK